MSAPLLEATGLSRRYGGVAAVDGIDLAIAEGEFRAIIGSNGAGKTTLFNLLTGAVRPSAGRIRYGGQDITRLAPHRRARLGIGRTFQINNVFGSETVAENVRIALIARHRRQWDLLSPANRLFDDEVDEVLARVGLVDERARSAGALSYGDRRRLEIALALAARPKLLFLDEPTCGMSLSDRLPLIDLIRRLVAEAGLTAVIIEHDMDIVFSVAERVLVMHRGRLIADGTPAAIAADDTVRRVYLGETPGPEGGHA